MTGVSHVVVDGSNIATEGRSVPSLAQLETAVEELRREMPATEVIVVVDATFAHRIEAQERSRFEEAALRGEYVYPPAGAIGRGDAFLLRIAEKIDATVLSNDSFQEFHGEHDWLFERGRLLGGTPVPGVGWIFVQRTPVRGPKSRIAVRDSERAKSKVEKAIAAATKEAVAPPSEPKAARKGKKKGDAQGTESRRAPLPRAVNDPLTFISFVADHPLGVDVLGDVLSFTSHGAIVSVGDMQCYVPLSGLGDPPPRSAREVLHKDEQRTFVVTALDPQRRGVELALPEVAVVSGRPTEETVEAEVAMTRAKPARRARKAAPAAAPVRELPPELVVVPAPPPAPKARQARKTAGEVVSSGGADEGPARPVKPPRAAKAAAAPDGPPAGAPKARRARKAPPAAAAEPAPVKPSRARKPPSTPAVAEEVAEPPATVARAKKVTTVAKAPKAARNTRKAAAPSGV